MFQVRKRISVIFTAARLSALDDRSASRFRGFFEPSRLQSVMPHLPCKRRRPSLSANALDLTAVYP
jgi:hypothetical protein